MVMYIIKHGYIVIVRLHNQDCEGLISFSHHSHVEILVLCDHFTTRLYILYICICTCMWSALPLHMDIAEVMGDP